MRRSFNFRDRVSFLVDWLNFLLFHVHLQLHLNHFQDSFNGLWDTINYCIWIIGGQLESHPTEYLWVSYSRILSHLVCSSCIIFAECCELLNNCVSQPDWGCSISLFLPWAPHQRNHEKYVFLASKVGLCRPRFTSYRGTQLYISFSSCSFRAGASIWAWDIVI